MSHNEIVCRIPCVCRPAFAPRAEPGKLCVPLLWASSVSSLGSYLILSYLSERGQNSGPSSARGNSRRVRHRRRVGCMHSGAAYLRAQGGCGWAAEQSMPQWGERRHTLEQLNHRSKIGLGRSMNADLRRPHTMAGVATESDLNHRRVVPVLGAQFRSRPTSSADDRSSMQGSASCPGCAALNSKLHKNHKQLAELAELRSREKEARTLAERCKEREQELEEGWRSHQQKIGLEFERMRREAHDGVQKAREAAEAADSRAARLQASSSSAIARRPSPASMSLAPCPHRHPRPHPRPRPTLPFALTFAPDLPSLSPPHPTPHCAPSRTVCVAAAGCTRAVAGGGCGARGIEQAALVAAPQAAAAALQCLER